MTARGKTDREKANREDKKDCKRIRERKRRKREEDNRKEHGGGEKRSRVRDDKEDYLKRE